MAKDYAPNIATAQRLITEFGRNVTLVAYDTTESDTDMPWDGSYPTDPRTTPDATLTIPAVFAFPTGVLQLARASAQDDLLARVDQLCIISPGATVDVEIYDEIIDGAVRWTIERTEVLKPANDTVLAYLWVKR